MRFIDPLRGSNERMQKRRTTILIWWQFSSWGGSSNDDSSPSLEEQELAQLLKFHLRILFLVSLSCQGCFGIEIDPLVNRSRKMMGLSQRECS
eukprot:scaffold80854_cov34-Attheya_sp.AAC.2